MSAIVVSVRREDMHYPLDERRPSLGERSAALALDTSIVYAFSSALESTLAARGVYLPFEASFAALAVTYVCLSLAWKGTSIGKSLCGLAVCTRDERRPGFARAVTRETIGKALSALPFFLGFAWAAFRRDGRAWHDLLAGTYVVRRVPRHRWTSALVRIVLVACAVLGAIHGYRVARLYLACSAMAPAQSAISGPRTPAAIEVSTISETEDERFARWLDAHAHDSLSYAVGKCSEHAVVLFGETHGKREALRFLNDLIPRAHAEAGLTCVAMEACLAEDDEALQQLVTARAFDRELALRIARHHPWRTWGWKGYWDVLETVWRLNQSIPASEPKIRVIGLDVAIDLPSAALAGIGDQALDGPRIEKLRLFRVLPLLPRMLLRDAFMAREVEEQILRRGERGLVWVGAAHAAIHCRNPGPAHGGWGRMGYMLRQKHGAEVFQIRVHDADIPVSMSNPAYRGPAPAMSSWLERVMSRRDHAPTGFDTAGSPFEPLRDSGSWDYAFDPDLRLANVAAGYVYLAPARALNPCEWLAGYVSEEMFVADKPFYVALGRRAGREVRSAGDADGQWITR